MTTTIKGLHKRLEEILGGKHGAAIEHDGKTYYLIDNADYEGEKMVAHAIAENSVIDDEGNVDVVELEFEEINPDAEEIEDAYNWNVAYDINDNGGKYNIITGVYC